MKLAFTHPYGWPEVRRGSERIVVESARAMAARGHDVTIFSAGASEERAERDGVTTVRFRRRFERPVRHEAWFGYRIMPHLLRGRFDAVHAMMPRDALAAVHTRRLSGHRVVYEELGIPARWFWSEVPDGRARRRLVDSVDVYGVMSNYALDILAADWGRKGDLIPGGVRLSEFRPAERRATQPTILFSGALSEARKGLPDLLAALDLLIDERPRIQLWLSGPGDPAGMVAAAPSRVRDRVTVLPLGDPADQSARYATAWVTALPSVGDSFGMALIESLASGTPIVVANHGAPPQLTTPATGVVVEPRNPQSLADGLREGMDLALDPATATRCRRFAAQFDWDESLAGLLENLYRGDRPRIGTGT
ncbi:MAG: glycosyltransferase family 4 protein [Acidimicrobiales bacterium]